MAPDRDFWQEATEAELRRQMQAWTRMDARLAITVLCLLILCVDAVGLLAGA